MCVFVSRGDCLGLRAYGVVFNPVLLRMMCPTNIKYFSQKIPMSRSSRMISFKSAMTSLKRGLGNTELREGV